MQFFQFHIIEVPNVSKEVMMWLVGLIFLAFLFHRSTATSTAKELRDKLKQKGCIPELYTFSGFQRANAVYAKIMLPTFKNGFVQFNSQQSIMYIGSTRLKPAQRESNRQAKIKQLRSGSLPKVELAIRYWVDNANYGRFVTLTLSGHNGYRDAWATEHATIQAWQARLNHPFTTKFLVKKAHGLVPAKQRPSLQPGNYTLAVKLFKRMRRRLHQQRSPEVRLLPQLPQLWELLYDLSSDTLKEFEASQILRSGRYPSGIGLVLFRLANHLEQPWRSKCATRLKPVLQFRNQSIPKKNRPLKIPFLAHEGFRARLQHFLHQEVRRAQPVLIPYHLPTTRPLEAPPTKVIKLLWSDVKDLPPPISACSRSAFLHKQTVWMDMLLQDWKHCISKQHAAFPGYGWSQCVLRQQNQVPGEIYADHVLVDATSPISDVFGYKAEISTIFGAAMATALSSPSAQSSVHSWRNKTFEVPYSNRFRGTQRGSCKQSHFAVLFSGVQSRSAQFMGRPWSFYRAQREPGTTQIPDETQYPKIYFQTTTTTTTTVD